MHQAVTERKPCANYSKCRIRKLGSVSLCGEPASVKAHRLAVHSTTSESSNTVGQARQLCARAGKGGTCNQDSWARGRGKVMRQARQPCARVEHVRQARQLCACGRICGLSASRVPRAAGCFLGEIAMCAWAGQPETGETA